VLYQTNRDLSHYIDTERIYYGEGRGEVGICLHLPLKNHVAGGAPTEDYALMIETANNLIDYLLHKRPVRGPEAWDYDAEKAGELYAVCGDSPNTSGIVVADRHHHAGAKLHVYLDKSFGANEVSIRWRNQLVGDECLLSDYLEYLKQTLVPAESVSEQS